MKFVRVGAALTALLVAPAALAHGSSGGSVDLMAGWAWWITAITVVVIVWYAAGVRRRARHGRRESLWRQAAFYSGVLILHFAVEPPLDVLEEHLFSAHMFQHMIIRMVGPMLLALSVPLANLIAGLPRVLRSYVLKPLVSARPLRKLWQFLVHPFWAALLWMAAFYVWQWPPFFNMTVSHEGVDDLQHVVLLITALFFWWMAFDPRGRPGAVRYGTRVLTVLATLFPNILIGAYITFTRLDLYRAYELSGRIWDVGQALDQQIGGLIIWVPGSMMTVIGVLIVFSRWLHDEAARPLTYQQRRHASIFRDRVLTSGRAGVNDVVIGRE
jgi:putative membrane protein